MASFDGPNLTTEVAALVHQYETGPPNRTPLERDPANFRPAAPKWIDHSLPAVSDSKRGLPLRVNDHNHRQRSWRLGATCNLPQVVRSRLNWSHRFRIVSTRSCSVHLLHVAPKS